MKRWTVRRVRYILGDPAQSLNLNHHEIDRQSSGEDGGIEFRKCSAILASCEPAAMMPQRTASYVRDRGIQLSFMFGVIFWN